MSGHPLLTTNVYIGIAVAFLAMMVYWFFYSRSVRAKQASLREAQHRKAGEAEGAARGSATHAESADGRLER